jgi:hypothetical protein
MILPVALHRREIWSSPEGDDVDWRREVFDSRMLGRILGRKRRETTEGWKELYKEQYHNLYSTPNTIRINKSRRMRWADNITDTGQLRIALKF